MHWKWWIFTSVVVGALIALGVGAVDERDVVWEARTPLCGYCRAELPYYAHVCRECDRALDWVPHQEECQWCLSREDVKHLRSLYDAIRPEEGESLPPALAAFGPEYFLAMDPGTCTYCGGVGKVVESSVKVDCPVCRGEFKRCIACGGDRAVWVGDMAAHQRALDRREAWAQAERRAQTTDLPLDRKQLVDDDVEALRGYVQAEELTDARGRKLLPRARERIEKAFRALHAEYERRKRGQPAESGS